MLDRRRALVSEVHPQTELQQEEVRGEETGKLEMAMAAPATQTCEGRGEEELSQKKEEVRRKKERREEGRLTSGVALAVQHGGVGSNARPGRKKERGAAAGSGVGRQGEGRGGRIGCRSAGRGVRWPDPDMVRSARPREGA